MPAPYRGLERVAARERIVADLEALGLHRARRDRTSSRCRAATAAMRCSSRCSPTSGSCDIEPLAAPAIRAVEDGRIRFVPEHWSAFTTSGCDNIKDWCISRQLWWGHRIPAWYDRDGDWYVGPHRGRGARRAWPRPRGGAAQDEDVLDTWFSSALWPFSTQGWPEQTRELAPTTRPRCW